MRALFQWFGEFFGQPVTDLETLRSNRVHERTAPERLEEDFFDFEYRVVTRKLRSLRSSG